MMPAEGRLANRPYGPTRGRWATPDSNTKRCCSAKRCPMVSFQDSALEKGVGTLREAPA